MIFRSLFQSSTKQQSKHQKIKIYKDEQCQSYFQNLNIEDNTQCQKVLDQIDMQNQLGDDVIIIVSLGEKSAHSHYLLERQKVHFTKNCQQVGVNSQNPIKCSTKFRSLYNLSRNPAFKIVGKPILPQKNLESFYNKQRLLYFCLKILKIIPLDKGLY